MSTNTPTLTEQIKSVHVKMSKSKSKDEFIALQKEEYNIKEQYARIHGWAKFYHDLVHCK